MASAGPDANDPATQTPDRPRGSINYTTALAQGNLKGLRLGMLEAVLSSSPVPEQIPVQQAFEKTITSFSQAGAVIVRVTSRSYSAPTLLATLDTQRHEYREVLDAYLNRPDIGTTHPKDFASLYASNDYLVIPTQYSYINSAHTLSTSDASYAAKKEGIASLKQSLLATLNTLNLDAIIYPQQKCLPVKIGSPSQHLRHGILAALTGFPSVCVPIGFSAPSGDAPRGVPVGMEILGRPWEEEKLLQIAYQIEQLMQVRRPPAVAEVGGEAVRVSGMIPEICPDISQISQAYPQGVLQ